MVAAIAVAAGWNAYLGESKVALSELGLANVEALANGEGSGTICTAGCTQISWGVDSILKCNCKYTGWFSSCKKWGCVQ